MKCRLSLSSCSGVSLMKTQSPSSPSPLFTTSFLPGLGYFRTCSMAHLVSFPRIGGHLLQPSRTGSPLISKKKRNHYIVLPLSYVMSWNFRLRLLTESARAFSQSPCSDGWGKGLELRPANNHASAMAWCSKERNVRTRGRPTIPRVCEKLQEKLY